MCVSKYFSSHTPYFLIVFVDTILEKVVDYRDTLTPCNKRSKCFFFFRRLINDVFELCIQTQTNNFFDQYPLVYRTQTHGVQNISHFIP